MSILSEEETSTAIGSQSTVSTRTNENVLTYTREEMVKMRESTLSRTRPDNLSTQFDGEDGLFSPQKWIEYRWECEGVKNRPTTRKNELLKEEGESTVLSPQRRGFSSGCRAPEDKGNEEEGEQQKRNWRAGANGGQKREEFKQGFKGERESRDRRGGGNATPSWRSNDARNDSKAAGKGYGYGNRNGNRRDDERGERVERLPEWADGQTTVNDMIELKGFDEPKKKERKQNSQPSRKNGENGGSKTSSRPSSNPSAQASVTAVTPSTAAPAPPPVVAPAVPSQPQPQPVTIPSSDEEFAKILGLLDTSDHGSSDFLSDIMHSGVKEEPQAVTGSRLSRFFKSRADDGNNKDWAGTRQSHLGTVAPPPPVFEHELTGTAPDSSSVSTFPPPFTPSHSSIPGAEKTMLARIFENSAGGSKAVPPPVATAPAAPPARGPVTLEDLERNLHPQVEFFKAQQQAVLKGNPLQDPREQASLLSKLQRVAREQDGGGAPPVSNSTPSTAPLPPTGAFPPHPLLMNPALHAPMRDPAHVAQVMAQAQYYAAMQQAAAAMNGPVPPQIQEQIRQAAMKSLLQTQALLSASQGVPPLLQQSLKRPPAATSLIPAAVQKQMSKNAGAAGDKSEKSHDVDLEKAEAAKRALMQQQYAVMMNAMQGGLSMGAWRAPQTAAAAGAAAVQPAAGPRPTPAQVAAFMQHQALKKQQMAKLLMMQGQQAAAMQHAADGIPPTAAVAPHPPQPPASRDDYTSQPMQNPLEKLLAAAGLQSRQLPQHSESSLPHHELPRPFPPSSRPIPLEELERRLTESK